MLQPVLRQLAYPSDKSLTGLLGQQTWTHFPDRLSMTNSAAHARVSG